MRIEIILISCWVLLVRAAGDVSDVSDIEKILLAATEKDKGTDNRAGANVNEKLCNIEGGGVGKCVKKNLCELTAPPLKTPPKFIYRELVNGKCKYFEQCCPEEKIRTTAIKQPRIRRPVSCGYSNPGVNDLRELAGAYSYADFGDFPWMVALLNKKTNGGKFSDAYLGGGTLIDPSVVLTVAHKVYEITAADLKLRAGEWDANNEGETYPHQDRDARTIIVHEDFDPENAYNDVALIILKEPFLLDDAPHIGVACLEKNLPRPGTECFSMGWGKDFQNGELYANVLKKLKLPLVASGRCENSYRNSALGRTYNLHKSLTCAGGMPGVDTCDGDGGSSLVCSIPDISGDRYSVVGMVAYGLECGTGNLPGVYAKIPELYDWIYRQMSISGFSKKQFVY